MEQQLSPKTQISRSEDIEDLLKSTNPTLCRICGENCGILVADDGNELRITGNPLHPISNGFICPRGMNFGEVHYAPDRLHYPRLRKGSDWIKISYEEALEVLASNLQSCKEKYGAESVVFYEGESLKHQEITRYMSHLAFGFGTPNLISVGSLCQFSVELGHGLTYGKIPLPDFRRMKTAIVWGANPAASSFRLFRALNQAVMDGTNLIVIDPSRTETAKIADLHLPVIPGSDGFLALAFVKYAIEKAQMKPQTPVAEGWDELKELVHGVSYGSLLERTGIPEDHFNEASALIFGNLPGWILTGLGLELNPCGVQSIRAIASLQSLLDRQHAPSPLTYKLKPFPGKHLYPDRPDPIGAKESPLYIHGNQEGQGMYLVRAILDHDPYPVKAMLITGGNPILTFPDSKTQKKAFQELDFLAVFDLFMTPTAQLANLVFPAADFLENLELHDYGQSGRPYLGLIKPVTVSTKGWPAWKFIFELARRLGLGKLFPWKDNREALIYKLSENGIELSDLENSPSAAVSYKNGDSSNSPCGKTHYHSKVVEKTGHPGLPTLNSLRLPFLTDERFPFWLSTGDRMLFYQHSQFRNCSTYRARMEEPLLDIHSDAANGLHINNGEHVVLSTRYGKVRVRANVNDDLRKDCLRMTHGWAEANVNELTGLEYFDPISGFPWLRALPARVEGKKSTRFHEERDNREL
jgi:anaerobic selenocysteine-containing dehydrogenase